MTCLQWHSKTLIPDPKPVRSLQADVSGLFQFVSYTKGWSHFNGRHMLRKYSCYVTSVIYPMMSHLLDRTRATSLHAVSNLSTVRWIKSCLMEHLRHFFFFCRSMWVVISSDVWLTLWVIHEGCHVQNAVGPRCSKKETNSAPREKQHVRRLISL